MTTNQTIDGVPGLRELLERIAAHCIFWHDHAYLEAIQDIGPELRALLDAPAKPSPSCFGEHDLYARQPAPVADILPGLEFAWKHFDGLSTSQLITLQEMITEAKRMSASVVRPHHANPPPGTEPSGTHPHNDGLDGMRKP